MVTANDGQESAQPESRIIYRINCTDNTNALTYHTALAFEDAPIAPYTRQAKVDTRLAPEDMHLQGTRPIYDIDSYLTAEDDVAFVIVRETYCFGGASSLSQIPLNRTWDEKLWLKSTPLRSALISTASCYISHVQDDELVKSSHRTLTSTGITNNTLLIAEREMYLPRLFLYHHRTRLREYAVNHTHSQPHIQALLEYISQVYGADYYEADELLHRGLVTKRHLDKLFAPNELVFTNTDGHPTAYVVRKWPTTISDGHLQLDCWFWKSNGIRFARARKTLSVSIDKFDDKQVEIRHLSVLPLAHASLEVHSHLELRGRKHWEFRSQNYVSYTGWNISHDQYYVS